MAPRSNVVGTHNAGKDDYRPAGRTRVVAWVVGGLLLLHLLAILLILSIAKWAAADTEARLATLPWSFPVAQAASALPHNVSESEPLPLPTPQAISVASDAWLVQAVHKDTPRPWTSDAQGNVRWAR
jgi:hypothetical protein